jgi:transposase-like protein
VRVPRATRLNRAKKSGAFKEKPLEVNERARLKELEEENRRLKMERDLLKSRRRGLRARVS